LVVVGSPTRAFRPTPALVSLLKKLPKNALANTKIAAFHTGFHPQDIKQWILKLIVGWAGYAAQPLHQMLLEKGARPAQPPQDFWVQGTQGPLKSGELEKAAKWAETLLDQNPPQIK
jgi:hypothetical protein